MPRVIDRNLPRARHIARTGIVVTEPPAPDPVEGTAPPPLETGAGLSAIATPANFRMTPLYDAAQGGQCCLLKWDHNGVGIDHYAVHVNTHDEVHLTIPGNVTQYLVPNNKMTPNNLRIIAHGDLHAEMSLSSNWLQIQGLAAPEAAAAPNPTIDVPNRLHVTAQWQPAIIDGNGDPVAAHPRNVMTWYAPGMWFDIERDGVVIASGLWTSWYADHTPTPGASHTYRVRGSIQHTAGYTAASSQGKSAWSSSVTVTTRTARYPFLSEKITIKGTLGTHDGMMVYFAPVAGAADYRGYVIGREGGYKYTGPFFNYDTPDNPSPLTEDNNGTGCSIFFPGVAEGEQIVIEAVDKAGPFNMQTATAHRHAGWAFHTNGQMDPAGVPYSIAVSDPVTVSLNPVTPGAGEFFESFDHGEAPVAAPSSEIDSEFLAINGGWVQKYSIPSMNFYFVLCDKNNSQVFTTHNRHGMDLTWDGEDDDRNTQHIANASFILEPRDRATGLPFVLDLSGNKAVEISVLVSPNTGGRKWWELQIMAANDQMLNPGKFAELGLQPSRLRDILRWQFKGDKHFLQRFLPPTGAGQFDAYDIGAQAFAEFDRTHWSGRWPTLNGTNREIDKPSLFRMTVSRLKVRIEEICLFNPAFSFSKTRTFAPGLELPYTQGKVILAHQVYHTGEARNDAQRSAYLYTTYGAQYQPFGNFDTNCMPWNDEGHWDDIRIRPLAVFPS